MENRRGIQVRGYRRVFRIERRLHRFDRWRIPYPHGVPLRGIGYFVVLEFCVLLMDQLPGVGEMLSLVHPSLVYLGVPLGGAVLLMQARIDGRPPHHVLASLVAYHLRPRCLAGLEPCPGEGEVITPFDDVTVAHDAREAFVVRGRVRGPATVVFRYPSQCWIEGAPPWVRDPTRRRARARRFRIRRQENGRPMVRGKSVGLPRGREVVVE
jgi:TcpE family